MIVSEFHADQFPGAGNMGSAIPSCAGKFFWTFPRLVLLGWWGGGVFLLMDRDANTLDLVSLHVSELEPQPAPADEANRLGAFNRRDADLAYDAVAYATVDTNFVHV